MAEPYTVPLTFIDNSTSPPSYKLVSVTAKTEFYEQSKRLAERLETAVGRWVAKREGKGWELYKKNAHQVFFRDLEKVYSDDEEGLRPFFEEQQIVKLTFSDAQLTPEEAQGLGDDLFDLDRVILPREEG